LKTSEQMERSENFRRNDLKKRKKKRASDEG